jgi:hypothetical protein
MKFTARGPDIRQQLSGAQFRKELRAAAVIATARASKDAQRAVQERIRGAGLGRLANAVGQKSGNRAGSDPYGVIFARGGDDSLAGGALESYSRGATITAQNGQWLAIATKAVPQRIGRRRTTPALLMSSGAAAGIGQLEFKPLGNGRAALVFKAAAVNIRTGRARATLKRSSKVSVNQRDVIAFILIRVTRRAQRFDKDQVILPFVQKMPAYLLDALTALSQPNYPYIAPDVRG